MAISGVEDEFRIAAARGMDRLIYIYLTPLFQRPEAPNPDRQKLKTQESLSRPTQTLRSSEIEYAMT